MVRAWRKIHKKGRSELGPKNCITLESYTDWVRKRASEYLMPYDYPRPTPLVVAGPSTLPNQGVEVLRDEDLSHKLTHRYYTRANSSRLMDHLEQENRELKDEVARLSAFDGFIPG
ncbi:hypothetical protein KIW84_075931 [Lathyrus oleraceus]|uniref:Uncharacterized protein n=1 Tax=Pisum sativum TaxID=3888 RepID=A0A9D4ZYQ2_PEA|nr:hypothetical protein KIW84_075931 [Pisum sativum]